MCACESELVREALGMSDLKRKGGERRGIYTEAREERGPAQTYKRAPRVRLVQRALEGID